MTGQQVACPTCGNVIGEEITEKQVTLIHAGGGMWRELRGFCAQCGKQFFWSASDRQLGRLLKDILGPASAGAEIES